MTDNVEAKAKSWPPWARLAVSGLVLLHMLGVVVVGLALPPSSPLERDLADWIKPTTELIDQGHAHRYYVDPPPTPVLLARLRFGDGRPERTIRVPDRGARPRLLYQRQLALAFHLFSEFEQARRARSQGFDPGEGVWARSYARHLCKASPGCSGVTLLHQMHLAPDLERLRRAAGERRRLDVESDEFYTTPERIGEFSCDDF